MKPLRINIVLPFITTKPNGGAKVMYEYANRLHGRGHTVTVLHSIRRPYHPIKSPVWWKQFMYALRGLSRPPWFPLNAEIVSKVVPQITDEFVPDADISLSTWWEMAYMINGLSSSKGLKFNLIQGYEVWKGKEQLVHDSYKLPIRQLVIASYLKELVKSHANREPVLVPIAIDLARFRMTVSVSDRFPHSLIMMYSEEAHKGTRVGMEALAKVREQIPDLRVDLFGVYETPKDLPSWISYHQRPSDLGALLNRNAVFFSPSLTEGWALPPAEAMACGCAVVCTRIGGHADYAIDQQTALLVEPSNREDMIEKIVTLLLDRAQTERLAQAGHQLITTHFNWERSVDQLENVFAEESFK